MHHSHVASFVGDVNCFPGVVTPGVASGAMAIEVAGGVRLQARRCGFVGGAAVDVFVRPEEIAIVEAASSNGSDDGENLLTGTVAAHSYQGSFTHVVVALPGLPPVTLSAPGGDLVRRTRRAPRSGSAWTWRRPRYCRAEPPYSG